MLVAHYAIASTEVILLLHSIISIESICLFAKVFLGLVVRLAIYPYHKMTFCWNKCVCLPLGEEFWRISVLLSPLV